MGSAGEADRDDAGSTDKGSTDKGHPAGLDGPLDLPPAHPLRAVLAVLGLAVAAAIALATSFVGVGPAAVDEMLLGEAVDVRSGTLTTLAVLVTNTGSTAAMGVVAALAALVLLRRSRPYDALFVIATAAGASLLFTALKRLLDRARPPLDGRLVEVSNESLPSGHATMAMAVLGSLVVLLWAGRSTATRVAMVVVAALWVGAVGLSRIYLGVHWFSDVVAGWLVGGAWLALCATVAGAALRRRIRVS
jgi:undecaprenyl-diphosphatase